MMSAKAVIIRLVITIPALLMLAACPQNIPRQEVQQASQAYAAFDATAEPILNGLAIAARQLGARNAIAGAADADRLVIGDLRVKLTFNPNQAQYFSSIGEPESVAELRRGLRVAGDYFKTLVILAEGENIPQAKEQIQALAGSLAGLAALATGGAALPLGGVVAALGPLIEQAAQAQNAQELRRLILEGAQPVDALLQALEAASPAMYQVLKATPERAATGPLVGNALAQRTELEKIATFNSLLSDYVVLLRQVRIALKSLVAVVRQPNSNQSLASLAAASTNLLIDAKAASRAFDIFGVRTPR